MKRILLASLLATGVALPGIASAHPYGGDRYGYDQDRGYHHDRYDRDDDGYRDRDAYRDSYMWRHHYRHDDRDWRY